MHYAFTLPVRPGQAMSARQFTKQLLGPRKPEYDDLQRRGAISEERYFLQHTAAGDVLIVTGTGTGSRMADYLQVETMAFDRWFVDTLEEITGENVLDLTSYEPELMGEWMP